MLAGQKAVRLALLGVFLLQACTSNSIRPISPVANAAGRQVSASLSTEPITVDQLMQSCPTAGEISFIDSRLEIIFKGDPTAPDLVCTEAAGSKDLTLLQKNIYNVLRVMQNLRFDQPLPWTDSSLFDWFIQAVTGVVFDPDVPFSHCCDEDGRILITTQFLIATQTDLWVDTYYGGAGVGSLLPMMVHEARHSEGYVHDCTSKIGNDLNLIGMGAWAVEYYLDLWIANYSSQGFFADYEREISHANAELVSSTRFCPLEIPDWIPIN